jgi:hypothetical protein
MQRPRLQRPFRISVFARLSRPGSPLYQLWPTRPGLVLAADAAIGRADWAPMRLFTTLPAAMEYVSSGRASRHLQEFP